MSQKRIPRESKAKGIERIAQMNSISIPYITHTHNPRHDPIPSSPYRMPEEAAAASHSQEPPNNTADKPCSPGPPSHKKKSLNYPGGNTFPEQSLSIPPIQSFAFYLAPSFPIKLTSQRLPAIHPTRVAKQPGPIPERILFS
ncbi:hypothetical protein IAQ61_003376, partial [Plenodomus lingam]|uniref:Predicted protein n=1 Tax=Leptosphaeria maculans (strain JN3 / isolate v23.1.3 / race Av1-4-5-6-7-8) TaxID=985895 RepID=E5AEB6_LEPMJ